VRGRPRTQSRFSDFDIVRKLTLGKLLRRIDTRDDALTVLSAVSQSLYVLALAVLAYVVSILPQVWWWVAGLLGYAAFFALSGFFLTRRRSRMLATSVLGFALVLLASALRTTPIAHGSLKSLVGLVPWFLFMVFWILVGANAVRATWMFHRLERSKILLGNVILVVVLSIIYGFVPWFVLISWSFWAASVSIDVQTRIIAVGGVFALSVSILGLAGYLPGTRNRPFATVPPAQRRAGGGDQS